MSTVSRWLLAVAALCSIYMPGHAQDVIYQLGGKKVECTIIGVTEQKIKYRIPQNPGPAYSIEAGDVLVAFNQTGNYLLAPFTPEQMAGFSHPTGTRNTDILLTTDNQVIEALAVVVGVNEVKYKKPEDKKSREQKLPIDKLAVILYKDGKHEIVGDMQRSTETLRAVKSQFDQLTGVDHTLPTDVNANTSSATPASDDAVAFPGGPEEFEKFRNKALIKVDELGTYLATIVNPKTPAEKANSTIDLALTLFVNEDARVEVSNVNTGVKNKYKIRDYLRRLKLVGSTYQEVEVAYADISYATDFRKGPDGNYYGVVSFVQTFKGLVDGKVIYGDVTQRNVTVVLKLYEKADEGETRKIWDVFLADVGIEETRKL